jgi:hypothetical protein
LGLKKIETRGYPVPKGYRGPVAIHAAKKWDGEIKQICGAFKPLVHQAFADAGMPLWGMDFPLGQIIAVANLVECCHATNGNHLPGWGRAVFNAYPTLDTWLERALGNYDEGRYGWVLTDVKRLADPLPYKAHQGCYQLPPDIERQVSERVA